jgi:hypothetical protein
MASTNSYSQGYGRSSRGTMLPPARKASMSKPLVVALLGILAGFGVYNLMKPSVELLTGRSGKNWRVVLLGKTAGDAREYEVFAPAGSFGPHGELSVLRYSQKGSDMGSRKVTGIGQGVPDQMKTTAASDFGLSFSSGGALSLGTSS